MVLEVLEGHWAGLLLVSLLYLIWVMPPAVLSLCPGGYGRHAGTLVPAFVLGGHITTRAWRLLPHMPALEDCLSLLSPSLSCLHLEGSPSIQWAVTEMGPDVSCIEAF
jgi:hypothetical protein